MRRLLLHGQNSLGWILRRFPWGSRRESVGSEWLGELDRIIGALEELNRNTEQDFLAIGEKLMEFRSIAKQIASDMAVLTDLMAGEHGRNASQSLTKMLG